MNTKEPEMNPSFDIHTVAFTNVTSEFERKFKDRYHRSLRQIIESDNRLTHAGGATSMEILKAMSRRMGDYDKSTDFEAGYYDVQKELEPFTDT